MPSFGKRSRERLATAHPILQELFFEVVKGFDCTILCGHRTKMEQDALFYHDPPRTKAKFPKSKHNVLPSNAVDVMPYPIDWKDMDRLHEFAKHVKSVADDMDIPIEWGGDWESFFDGPHWQRKV